jgi:hypothetical protein
MSTSCGSLKVCLCLALALLGIGSSVRAEDVKVEATLVWGTNEDPGKFKDLKPVNPELGKLLRNFKWKNYLEINRKTVVLQQGKENTVQISKECKLILTYQGNSMFRVQLFGKGERVSDRTQKITLGEKPAVFGGDDKNDTAWFIFVTRLPVK